jgi:hypothetical protein
LRKLGPVGLAAAARQIHEPAARRVAGLVGLGVLRIQLELLDRREIGEHLDRAIVARLDHLADERVVERELDAR